MYQEHPSHILREIFRRKPYQGAQPETARFLFVGLDANYAENIEQSPIFPQLLAYHDDGPAFWRKYKVHHPFLLPEYAGDGLKYHSNFAQIGFEEAHADLVSFTELLNVPTVGRNKLNANDLDLGHLLWLRKVIFFSQVRFIFLSANVVKLIQATHQFPRIEAPVPFSGKLRIIFDDSHRTVYQHLHFSVYGKFEVQRQVEAREIAGLIQ